ncbi:MAG: 4-hydroxy-3-methylbut-2-enyl diphosphate reductase [Syntrophales bacterium]|jgi:4-hydroxy-3-methylbut-2-enyl diphosphate reductase|nr:4-hydroxy-3-methylbut-2-enyl diphosphate reductase [Syntrophales bacterium]
MSVRLAKTAGFCMGVRRAVDIVLDLAQKKGRETIYTYGPLIHNPQTVELLKRRGIVPIRSLDEIDPEDKTALLIIRAHGVSPAERSRIEELGIRIVDATCPRVTHVQKIIRKHASQGYEILILGDAEHPEVNGLLGFAGGRGRVIGDCSAIDRLPDPGKVCVVAQTTQDVEKFREMVARIRERFPDAVVFDTICDSTERRQTEVKELAGEMDAIFVVGGKNSANTCRLATLSELQGKPTFHIETVEDVDGIDIGRFDRIGVSAGASTPNWIIDRVVATLTERKSESRGRSRRLLRLWSFLVRTDIYSAVGAGCLSASCSLLQGRHVFLLYVLIASLYVYAMHTLNRLTDRRSGWQIGSFREDAYLRQEPLFIILCALALLVALVLAYLDGPQTFGLLLVISAAGGLYNVPLLPEQWRFRSLKDLPGSKNISMAAAWAASTALLPVLDNESYLHPSVIVSFLFVGMLVFIRSALSDVGDIQDDRFLGKETIPVVIGKKRTQVLLKILLAVLLALLICAPPLGWTSSVAFALTACVFYLWICLDLCDRRSELSGAVLEGLLETVYIIAGFGCLAWFVLSFFIAAQR